MRSFLTDTYFPATSLSTYNAFWNTHKRSHKYLGACIYRVPYEEEIPANFWKRKGKQCIQQRTKREKLYQLHTQRGCAAIDAPWSYRNKYDLWNHRHSEEIEQVYRCQCQFQINCKILWLIKYVIHHMAGHQEWDYCLKPRPAYLFTSLWSS